LRRRSRPATYWFGDRPEKLVDLRGDGVDTIIERVEAAVAAYPHPSTYRMWPGPNSNTFTAWVGQRVPELHLKAAGLGDRQELSVRTPRVGPRAIPRRRGVICSGNLEAGGVDGHV
jgi:hypothetical protein